MVDDDEDVREFLADALVSLGHRVETLAGGEAALAALDEGAPDLVLVDFAMPGMNGAELARAVARAPTRICRSSSSPASPKATSSKARSAPTCRCCASRSESTSCRRWSRASLTRVLNREIRFLNHWRRKA